MVTDACAPWNRLLWGVRFTGVDGTSFLIGDAWDNERRLGASCPYEPRRALLFTTRRAAREWVRRRREKYPAREAGWRFTVVRVRESVEEAR